MKALIYFGSIGLIMLLSGLVAGAELSGLKKSQAVLEEARRLQAEVAEIESESGPYSPDLLQPLQALVELNQTEQDFDEVAAIQSRQLQIMRTELGLDHPDNIAFVDALIATNIKRGAWDEVDNNLEHVRYLQGINSEAEPELLLQAVADQASWKITQMILGEVRRRPRNLLAARELYEELKDLAEDSFGKDDPAMVPWLYLRALNLHRLVAILNSRNTLASDTLERVVQVDGVGRLQAYNARAGLLNTFQFGRNNQVPVLDGDRLVGEAYLRDGLAEINNFVEIFEEQGDIEAQAMAEIYAGDFRVLTDIGSGRRSYNRARELLSKAGFSQERIAKYFAEPQLIPMPIFVSSLAEAEALKETTYAPSISENGTLAIEFTAQQEEAPTVRLSSDYGGKWGLELPSQFVEMTFDVSSRGVVSSADFLAGSSDEKGVRRKAMRAVRGLKFRPRFEGEKPVRVRDVRLLYRFEEDPR